MEVEVSFAERAGHSGVADEDGGEEAVHAVAVGEGLEEGVDQPRGGGLVNGVSWFDPLQAVEAREMLPVEGINVGDVQLFH